MFLASAQLPGSHTEIATKKALLVVNCQNDLFYHKDDFFITKNFDFVDRLRELIPYFRRIGTVIWVRTEMGVLPSTPSPDAEKVEQESLSAAEKNRKTQNHKEAGLERKGDGDPETDEKQRRPLPQQTYDPSSRVKRIMTHAPAEVKIDTRSTNLRTLDADEGESFEESLVKPRKGQQSKFFVAGTKGAEIADQLKGLIQQDDMVITKHFYSAFDQTSLLTSLRTHLITEVYLCGGLSNASIYSTAADAVQHGMEVSVVEDCMGYRSVDKHEEAMTQMSDIMGVIQTSSDEIIEESGGRIIPDSDTPGITLTELSIGADARDAQAALLAGQDGHGPPGAGPSTGQRAPGLATSVEATDSMPNTPTKVSHTAGSPSHVRARSRPQVLGPDDPIGSGDSKIVHDWLDDATADKAFHLLRKEVDWQKMGHRGGHVPRLVAVQGEVGEHGEVPIYRHPADEAPRLRRWSPTVLKIKKRLETLLDQPFNHVLIQLYRTGEDNISEHSDKTLDIVHRSSVVNVSLGAQRTMTLRTKKSPRPSSGFDNSSSSSMRNTQRVPLPHNSVFVLGPQSNSDWLHGVRADKRPPGEKTVEEKAFGGERVSLTFRHIGTFLLEEEERGRSWIWGSGARHKRRASAGVVVGGEGKGQAEEMERMIVAFGRENHQNGKEFDWEGNYGVGFDVVDVVLPPTTSQLAGNAQRGERTEQLVLSSDQVANLRVMIALEEAGIAYEIVDPAHGSEGGIDGVVVKDGAEAGGAGATAGAGAARIKEKPWIHGLSNTENPILKLSLGTSTADGGNATTTVEGDIAILLAIERRQHHYYDNVNGDRNAEETSQLYRCIAQANELLYCWYEFRQCVSAATSTTSTTPGGGTQGSTAYPTDRRRSSPTHRFQLENLQRPLTADVALREELWGMLRGWEDWLGRRCERKGGHSGHGGGESHPKRHDYITGDDWSVVDCAFWPVLKGIVEDEDVGVKLAEGKGDGKGDGGEGGQGGGKEEEEESEGERWEWLGRYHRRALRRDGVRRVTERQRR